jgi:hypothetical protein
MVDFFQNKKIFQKIKYSVKKKMLVKKKCRTQFKKNIYDGFHTPNASVGNRKGQIITDMGWQQ